MLRRKDPDFGQLLKVLRREGRPAWVPAYEHLASSGFIARSTGTRFDRMRADDPDYWRIYVDFWIALGFDCIPMEVGLDCPLPERGEGLTEGSESRAVIHDREEYERYPWPPASRPIEYRHFDTVSRLLPPGSKIVGGVGSGPFEWASKMMGLEGLSYAVVDDPGLVAAVFGRLGALFIAATETLARMDAVGALRQGDDLGFRSSTFLSPADLRKTVFPIYKRMADIAHANGKPFILHSCGNLNGVYDDLIERCGIDAKHSFEDSILPVTEFKRRHGARMTPLGGIDVDVLCRGTEGELRSYVRRCVETCFGDGHWAVGSGSSLTDYMPVRNYLIALDEARKTAG